MNKAWLHIFLGVGILATVVLLWFFVFHSSPSIANDPSAGTDVIAFGDSLVAGYGADPGNDFVSLLSQILSMVVDC